MSLTLERIAELAGVSRSTVSRVVNDQPNVRDQVRERVWRIIHETGYEPHAAARSLVTHRTQIIGVIIPEEISILFTEPFFVRLLSGVTEACNSNQYYLMLALLNDPAGQEAMYRRVVRGGHLDGAVIASTPMDDPLIPRLLEDRLPFVLIGRHRSEQVSYVDIDNVAASQMAVEHLIRLGHRRIGTITGRLNMSSGQDRLEGYRKALAAHRIPVEEELVIEGDFGESSGVAGAQRLIAASATAIFAASDSMAVGAMKTIRHAGLHVPRDVALVGFDDVTIASAVEPALTTVRQPIERLASMAFEVLLSMLENPSNARSPGHKIILPTKLVVRESCGALPWAFGVNDETALSVIEVAQKLGRRVPDDLSVVGFDNIDLASCVAPALTTMHVDKEGMGRLAVHLLVNRVNHPEASPVTAVVRPRLVERDSVRTI